MACLRNRTTACASPAPLALRKAAPASHGRFLAPPLSAVCTQNTPGRQVQRTRSGCSGQNERGAPRQQRRRGSGGCRGPAIAGAVGGLSHAAAALEGVGGDWAVGMHVVNLLLVAELAGLLPAQPPTQRRLLPPPRGADAEADGVGEARGAGPREHCRPHVPHGPHGHAGAGHRVRLPQVGAGCCWRGPGGWRGCWLAGAALPRPGLACWTRSNTALFPTAPHLHASCRCPCRCLPAGA